MTMKNDTKFEEKLTGHFKIDMTNLTKCDPSNKRLEDFHFNGILLNKVYNVWAKKKYRVIFHDTEQ